MAVRQLGPEARRCPLSRSRILQFTRESLACIRPLSLTNGCPPWLRCAGPPSESGLAGCRPMRGETQGAACRARGLAAASWAHTQGWRKGDSLGDLLRLSGARVEIFTSAGVATFQSVFLATVQWTRASAQLGRGAEASADGSACDQAHEAPERSPCHRRAAPVRPALPRNILCNNRRISPGDYGRIRGKDHRGSRQWGGSVNFFRELAKLISLCSLVRVEKESAPGDVVVLLCHCCGRCGRVLAGMDALRCAAMRSLPDETPWLFLDRQHRNGPQ